jgi:hypothetical protein
MANQTNNLAAVKQVPYARLRLMQTAAITFADCGITVFDFPQPRIAATT